MSSEAEHDVAASIPALWDRLDGEVAAGRRLADLFGTATAVACCCPPSWPGRAESARWTRWYRRAGPATRR